MKQLSIQKVIGASAALTILGFVAFTPAAQAGDYCVTNTSGMRGCPYATMEQCQASIAGGAGQGPCYRDPFLPAPGASNALAYHPKHVGPHKRVISH